MSITSHLSLSLSVHVQFVKQGVYPTIIIIIVSAQGVAGSSTVSASDQESQSSTTKGIPSAPFAVENVNSPTTIATNHCQANSRHRSSNEIIGSSSMLSSIVGMDT